MRSDRDGGGQHLRIRQGMQMISEGIVDSFPKDGVRLSSAVSSITQDGSSAEVETTNNIIRARKVISTVPSSVLKTIASTPPLPAAKQLWVESSTYRYYTKAMMIFRTPFWVEKGYCGLIQSFTGPASVIRDTSSLPDKRYVLTCFMSGDPGRAWAALPAGQRENALVKQIGHLFNSEAEAAHDFVGLVTYEWVKDQYARWGCPCIALTPSVLDAVGGVNPRAGRQPALRWDGDRSPVERIYGRCHREW